MASRGILNFRGKAHLRRPFTAHNLVTIFAVLAIISAIVVGWWLYFNSTDTASPAALIAASIAAIALLYGAYHSFWSQKVKLTLDLVYARFNNASYIQHSKAFTLAKDSKDNGFDTARTKKADLTTKPADGSEPPILGVLHLYNYWEFLATAYTAGHLDRSIFEDVASDLIVDLVEPLSAFIGELRGTDSGCDPTNWEHLVALFYLFASDEKLQKCVKHLGPPPRQLSVYDRDQWVSRYGGINASREYLNC